MEYNKTLTEGKKNFRAWPLWRGGGRGNRHGQYRWRRASWRSSWRIWLCCSYWGRLSIPFPSVSQSDTVCIVCACPPTAAATCRTFSRGFVWNGWAFPWVWLWPGIIHALATQAHCLSYLLAYLCQQSELQAPPASALASKTEVPLLPLPQAVQLARWCQAAYSQCASTQCGPKGTQTASAQHGIVTPGLSERLSDTCAVQCDVPLMACVHVCTPSRAASYEGCVSWLPAMCILVRLFVLVIDHSASLLRWQHSVINGCGGIHAWGILRYVDIYLLLSAGSLCDSRVRAVFVPGCVPLLVLAAQVWHCHVITQDCNCSYAPELHM